jgi:nitrate reductase gamma subunit
VSGFARFAEDQLQIIALCIMAAVYTTRLFWLFRFKAGRDRQPRTGRESTDSRKGSLWSVANVAMPWAMESTRRNPIFWIQFVLFHLGVVLNISMSFMVPYWAGFAASEGRVRFFQGVLGVAFVVGCLRIVRRLSKPVMRRLSSPDDYFSLGMITSWLLLGALTAPGTDHGIRLAYFLLTAFFLVYVPFSKISHYLYYPFTRWWLGRTMGYRGVFPLERRVPGAGA